MYILVQERPVSRIWADIRRQKQTAGLTGPHATHYSFAKDVGGTADVILLLNWGPVQARPQEIYQVLQTGRFEKSSRRLRDIQA